MSKAFVGQQSVLVNGVELSVETFGDPAHPAILLIQGTGNSMLSWAQEFCERLAAGSRFVVRYDHRDTGRSVNYGPGVPPYTLRDLAADVVGLLDAFGLVSAHLVGMSMGGWIGQLVALDHPDRVASLTLMSTMPTGPGPNDRDLPEVTDELLAVLTETADPDWSDRAAVVEYFVEGERPFAGSLGFDEAALRELAGQVADRALNIASMTNHYAIDAGEPWRGRLAQVAAPTLVVHGTDDLFFPYGNAVALAEEIPGARLLALPGVGHQVPPRAVWDVVVPALVEHTSAGG